MKRGYRILLLTVLISIPALGQSFKERLTLLANGFVNAENIHIKTNVLVYQSDIANPMVDETIEIWRGKSNYLYKTSEIEMVLNDRYFIIVNHSIKMIMWRTRNKSDEMTFESKMSVTDIDSLLSGYSTPELIYNSDNLEKYRLSINKGVIDKMEVSFDSKKNIIQNIYYKYRNGTPMEGNRVNIDYEIFDLTSIPDENLFDENQWLSMKDKPTGIGRLSEYTVQGE